jgi:hypothetical protein
MTTKIIVTNRLALTSKYGGSGFTFVQGAVSALILADKTRGITTLLLFVDDISLGVDRVVVASDPAQNKRAIDAICATYSPDYVMILGSVDVIPHQDLINPCFGQNDPDRFAFSDLPYACAGSYSQQIVDFIGPVRVIGRLPDVTGAKHPQYLLDVLNVAIKSVPRPVTDYTNYLGVSAKVWMSSTASSLANIFGNASNLKASPPDGPTWALPIISARSHFVNCHGSQSDPNFYGQDSSGNYPIAHQAAYLPTRLSEGTVASCECCYGAELYPPLANGQLGMANAYLKEKAYAYFGSTTIAYGPAVGNSGADLICQYFLQEVLSGASSGRAALQAQQRFIGSVHVMTPVDAKTLAQFIFLGDPSLQPVQSPKNLVKAFRKAEPQVVQETDEVVEAQARSFRRMRLAETGKALAHTVPVIREEAKREISKAILAEIDKRAKQDGVDKAELKSFGIKNPETETFAKIMTKETTPQVVHLATARLKGEHPNVNAIVAYVIIESDSGFSLETFYSR